MGTAKRLVSASRELVLGILEDVRQLEHGDSPWRWRVAHVCKYWREMVFAYPGLWTRPLVFNHLSKLLRFRAELQLFRPLDIRLNLLQCDSSAVRGVSGVLSSEISQIFRLELSVTASQFESRHLDPLVGDVVYTQLSDLSVTLARRTGRSLEMQCPLLQFLALERIVPKSWDRLVSAHLTQLTLTHIRVLSSDFRGLLQLGCNIETLSLRDFGFLDAPDPFTSPLPHLRVLKVSDTYAFVVTMLHCILRARAVRELATYVKSGHPAGDDARYMRVGDLPRVHTLRLDPWDCTVANAAGMRRTWTYLGADMLRGLVSRHALHETLTVLNIAMSLWAALVDAVAAETWSLSVPVLEELTIRLDSRGRVHGRELLTQALADDTPRLRCRRLDEFTLDGRQNAGWPQPDGALVVQLALALGAETLRSVRVVQIPLTPADRVALDGLRTDHGVRVEVA
ncbi:hypothetical protein AURDEDRAFT_180886 [Auricularia subglabra TFB-10046 SS5]|nr:hypothetical protein AURDEDRAFT_180886 [Auricularia subglabra TFB-10046 SS5]